MRRGFFAVLLMLSTSATLYAQSDSEQDQREFPKIAADDLGACKKEIADLHRVQLNYIKNEVGYYCARDNLESCNNMKDWLDTSSTTSNLAWFMEGQTGCEQSLMCFGLSQFNEEPSLNNINLILSNPLGTSDEVKLRSEYRNDNAEDSAKLSPKDSRYYENQYVLESKFDSANRLTNKCIAKIWMAKLEANSRANAAAKKSDKKSSGKSAATSVASQATSNHAESADSNRSKKVHNPAADAKECTKLIEGRERGALSPIEGKWTFVNNCPTAVEFFWCSDAECDRDSGNTWTIRAGGSWPVSGTNVRWGACRGKDSGGFDKGSQGETYTCPLLQW